MAEGLGLKRRIALDLTRKLQDELIREHPLMQLFWECTLRCNLACRHCGSDCKAVSGVPDMPREDFGRVLDSVARAYDPHKVMVNITGGEPLMRADLEACGRMIYEKGFPWGMVSNGFALTPQRYERLLGCGLRAMTVSLDGLEPEHDRMRGRAGSYRRAVEAIRMVIASGEIEFDVVTCVNSRNLQELPALKELLIGLGLKRWRLFTVFPTGRAAGDRELQLSTEQMRSLMEFIRSTRKEGRISASYGCEGFLGRYEGEVRDQFFFCSAGVTVGSVLADGAISACPSIRADYHQGNIYSDDFVSVWKTKFGPYRDRTWMHRDACGSCSVWKYCRGNGFHLRDGQGRLLFCHLERLGLR